MKNLAQPASPSAEDLLRWLHWGCDDVELLIQRDEGVAASYQLTLRVNDGGWRILRPTAVQAIEQGARVLESWVRSTGLPLCAVDSEVWRRGLGALWLTRI